MSERPLLVVSSNPDGAGVRHRWRAYAAHLARAGVALDVARWGDRDSRDDALRRAGHAAAVVVAGRLLSLPGRLALRRRSRRLGFDLDDALPFHDSARGATLSRTRARRFGAMVRCADRVFAGNLYLAGLVANAGGVADVLPTTVEVPEGPVLAEPPGDPAVLGWIGARATIPYLEGIGDLLARLGREGRRIRVRAIADVSPRMPAGVDVDAVPWTSAGWSAALAAIHVGVAPLPDDRWTRGKCGLKVLQTMSLGRPVVASDVGMQGIPVRDGETGVLARSPDEMREGIGRLLDDVALRARLGAAAREEVRRRWSVDAWAARVVEVVEGLLA